MSEPISALAGFKPVDLYIGVADAGRTGQVTLKGELSDGKIAGALKKLTGAETPAPLTVTTGASGARVVWMAPDEVLILLPTGDAGPLVADLGEALKGVHHLATDVTDARAVLCLTGPSVPEVLAKGAPIDLSPAGFPVGCARRTHMAGIAVALWRRDPETWEIVCLRSYAHHLWTWLEAAARPGSEVG
ncbi:MAG: sarcosine oxidase subunit gamma family protein [Pseudomonadota bacterium]